MESVQAGSVTLIPHFVALSVVPGTIFIPPLNQFSNSGRGGGGLFYVAYYRKYSKLVDNVN